MSGYHCFCVLCIPCNIAAVDDAAAVHGLELLLPLAGEVLLRGVIALYNRECMVVRALVMCCCVCVALATAEHRVGCSRRKWRRLMAGRWTACSRGWHGMACRGGGRVSTIMVVGAVANQAIYCVVSASH